MSLPSVQQRYAPRNHCFGCGPANAHGLQIQSFEDGEWLRAEWMPRPQYEAFDGAVNGGILSTLLDCHSNWAAALHLMRRTGRQSLPATVTAELDVRFLRVTPSDHPLVLRARVVESTDERATVETSVESSGVTTATCRAIFVAVKEGHPAFHRW
jgi:uncharacterized protein (TIGR00369 family)